MYVYTQEQISILDILILRDILYYKLIHYPISHKKNNSLKI